MNLDKIVCDWRVSESHDGWSAECNVCSNTIKRPLAAAEAVCLCDDRLPLLYFLTRRGRTDAALSRADYRARRDHLLNNFSETNIDSRTEFSLFLSVRPRPHSIDPFRICGSPRSFRLGAHARGVKNLAIVFV